MPLRSFMSEATTVQYVCACVAALSLPHSSHVTGQTLLSGEPFIGWLQMCLSSSPIIQREIGIVTLGGIDSRQNRKVKIRLHRHLQPCATCSKSHIHSRSSAQIWNHMDEQLQYLGDNKSLRANMASLLSSVGKVWQVGYINLKWWRMESYTPTPASLSGW